MPSERRLLDQMPTDFERELLLSADQDVPRYGARTKALMALGLGASAGAVTASGAAQTLGTSSAASATTKGGLLAVAKWGAIGGLAGFGLIAATDGALRMARGAETMAPATAEMVAMRPQPRDLVRTVEAAPPAIAPATEPASPADPGADPAAASGAPAVRAPLDNARHAPGPTSVSDDMAASPISQDLRMRAKADTGPDNERALGAEVRALDDATHAIANGDGAGALARLDAYALQFPQGKLAPEASVLRVEALLASGNRDAARALAQRFVLLHPGSPFAEKATRLVGGPEKP